MNERPHLPPALRAFAYPFFLTIGAYLLAGVVNLYVLSVDLRHFGPPLAYWSLYFPGVNFNASLLPDLAVQIAIGCFLHSISRSKIIFTFLHLTQIFVLYIGNGAKIAHFGEPWVPTDWFLVRELVEVLPSWAKLLAGAFAVLFVALFLLNFRVSRATLVLLLAFLAPIGAITWSKPSVANAFLEQVYGYKRWAPIKNFVSRGATLYLYDEITRFTARRLAPPDQATVRSILARIGRTPSEALQDGGRATRNVHIIAAESLWDPTRLKGFTLTRDPWNAEFRALWSDTGHSMILSPVFGGGTANAEYEALCGLPANTPAMMFQTEVLNAQTPCLPLLLKKRGYHALASHPNRAGFWNRNMAFPRIGFDRFISLNDYRLDELRGPYLSDPSTLRQNLEHVAAAPKPVFNYVMTIAAHWPYNEDKSETGASTRERVEITPEDELAEDYINAIGESTEALQGFIRELGKTDPDALIVIFGDHLPLLGANFSAYRKGGLFPHPLEDFTPHEALAYTATPLIVLDGRKGPVAVGNIAMYELPRLITQLLGFPAEELAWSANRPEDALIRPIHGVGTLVLRDDHAELCKPDTPGHLCTQAYSWLDDVFTLARDINQGKRFALTSR